MLLITMGNEMQVKSQNLIIDTGNPVTPLFQLELEVPKGARQAYFSILDEYALAHNFRLKIAQRDKVREWFSTDLLGEQVVAMGSNISDSGDFMLSFLPAIGKFPPSSLVDTLQIDLRNRLAKFPAITIRAGK